MNNICRCCLDVVKDDIKYFQVDDNSSMYEILTGLSISAHDNLLNILCRQCYKCLTSVKLFRQTCLLAQNVLFECINNDREYSKDYITKQISEKRKEILFLKKQYLNNIILTESSEFENFFETNIDHETISTKENCISDIVDNSKINEPCKNMNIVKTTKIDTTNNDKVNDPAFAYIVKKKFSKKEILSEMQATRLTTDFETSLYKCVPCAKIFSTEFLLGDHILKHSTESGEFSCDICEQRHPMLKSLQRHIQRHLCLYVCTICDKRLYEQKAASMHIRRLHKELLSGNTNPVQCRICSKEFKNEIILLSHMKLHDDTKNFKCAHCTNVYTVRSSLLQHMRIHTGERPHVCSHCKASFTRRTALAVHIRTKHERLAGGDARGWYRCEPCDKTYISQGKLNEHLKIGARHVRADSYKFWCDRCGERFLRNRELVSHTARHHDDTIPLREYICHLCGRNYTSARSLTEHIMRHEGKTPHRCEHCDSKFVTRTSLKEHTANKHAHVAAIQFCCTVCPEKFQSRKELRRHNALIHSVQRKIAKFCCNVCGKEFTRKDSLKIHSVIHTGARKFRCEHCLHDFSQLSNLRRHLRTKHAHDKKNKQKVTNIDKKTQEKVKLLSLPKDLMEKIPSFLSIIDPNLQMLKNVEFSSNFSSNNELTTSNILNYDENTNETSAYNNFTDGFNLNLNDWNLLKNTLIFENPIISDLNLIRRDFTNNIADNEIQLNILESDNLTKSIELNTNENILGIDDSNNISTRDQNITKVSDTQVTVVVMSTGDGNNMEFTKTASSL